MKENVKDILEWVYCIIIALILALLFRYFIATPTIVKQRSMFPTLQENQRLILNRTFRISKKTPQRGDIITFEAPTKTYSKWEADQTNPIAVYDEEPKGLWNRFVYYSLEITKKSYIKRVIGIAGDHIKIEEFYDFIVPEGYFFAMGDNRTKSTDCREIGCIPLEKLEGIVCFRFWPISEFGGIE